MLHCTLYLPNNSEVVKFTIISEVDGIREEKVYNTDISVISKFYDKLGFFLADIEDRDNEG